MPKPLIILDHHFLNASKEFLIQHLRELKALGYQKVLFEMNQEISISDFRAHLKRMFKTPGPDETMDAVFEAFNRLFDAIEEFGLDCEFIDPEPLAVAQRFQHQLSRIEDHHELARVMRLREHATAERDVYMSERVQTESKRLSGGVIVFVGFKHTELLKRLSRVGLDHVPVLLNDSIKPKCFMGMKAAESREWLFMSDSEFRHAHYGQEVVYLDWAKINTEPFYLIKAQLGLSPLKTCFHSPLVAKRLAKSLDLESELKVDGSYHVQAYLPLELEAKIKAKHPGLRFFQTEDKICIPGINLAPQQEKI